MSYQVLARKWRPANFQQMVGQEHVLQALVNALDSNRLHHAYLFTGTRGVGKTTIARIFAKSLNCENGVSSEPCGSCASCSEIDEGRSVDLIEIDAASRTGVDDMRELLDNVQYAPTRGRYKIYLIDEVHMLSKHSFNALLKTLEEPPPHVKFLLATTDPQKVPVTVLSRCLQFNLKRMSRGQILSQLTYLTEQEKIEADGAALGMLAAAADGSMRDALSLLDQAIGYGGGAVGQPAVEAMLGSISRDYLERLFDALRGQRAADLVQEARVVIEHNPDYQRVCAEMLGLLQQIALYQTDPALVDGSDFDADLLRRYAEDWSAEEVQLYYQIVLQGRQDLLISPDEAVGFEMLMLRLLAFSPRQAAAPEAETPPPQAPPAEAPPAEAVKKKSELTPTPEAAGAAPPSTGIAPAPAPLDVTVTTPGADSPAGAAATAAAAAACNVDAGDPTAAGIDWAGLAYDLGLVGLGQEIVANSSLESWADGRLRLALLPEIHELASSAIEAEIRQALERKLEVSLRLELSRRDSLVGETPLQAKLRHEEQERLTAIEALRRDSTVQKLTRAFAAELDEDSVVRIENQSK